LKRLGLGLVALLGLTACGSADRDPSGLLGMRGASIVNGSDDRVEYFEVPDKAPEQLLVKQSTVALMLREDAELLLQGRSSELPTWAELEGLCAGEPFGEQPSAAFCTGTLLDANLVLTSNHCLRARPFGSWVVVFNYFYEGEGRLAMQPSDVYEPESVVAAEERDPESGEGADYAWLRLRGEAMDPLRAAQIFAGDPASLALNQALFSASAGGGVPIKLDFGASIRELRAPTYDYFVADSDTSSGSSGSPAFNANLEVLGVLVQGGTDFVATSEDCLRTARPQKPMEQFTHIHRTLRGLCEAAPESAPCRSGRGSVAAEGGCSFATLPTRHGVESLAVVALFAAARRRRQRR